MMPSDMDSYGEYIMAISKGTPESYKLRKPASKRRRVSDDVAWTASRCNRLLRTITSRISILQKLAASNRLSHSDSIEASNHSSDFAIDAYWNPGAAAPIATPSRDPEWLPSMQKSVKTYGGKKASKSKTLKSEMVKSRTGHNDLGLPTPFVKRLLKPDELASPPAPRDELRTASRSTTRSHSSSAIGLVREKETNKRGPRSLSVRPATTTEEAYRHLAKSLCTLLHATGPQEQHERAGASSLRSICLRKIPDYIRDLEELEESDDEDARNVTYDIYTELEKLGTNGSAGLRETVRAHGIWHIQRAILDKLIPVKTAQELICVCQQALYANAEARLLSEAALKASSRNCTFRSFLLTHNSSPSLILQALDDLLSEPSLTPAHPLLGCIYDQDYCSLLLEASLKEMRGTEVISLTSALSQLSANQNIAGVLRRCKDMVRQLAAVFAAVAESRGSSATMYAESVHRPATLAILDARDREVITESAVTPFLFASVLLQVGDQPMGTSLQFAGVDELAAQLLHDTQRPRARNGKAEFSFVSDVATVLGRSDVASGDHYLFETVHKLIRAAPIEPDTVKSQLLRRMALDGAVAYAETRQSKESFMFVEEIEDVLLRGARLHTRSTPAAKPKIDYRWEEGICEWVAQTPAAVQPARVKANEQTSGPTTVVTHLQDLSDHDTDIDELAFSVQKSKARKKRKVDCSLTKSEPFRPRKRWRRQYSEKTTSSSSGGSLCLSDDASGDELGI